jgi:DNA-binding NtrC family response regulator
LRERREDVRTLAEFFLHRLSARRRGPQMRFTDDALDMLDAYDWPGNVRELENTIQRACALCNSDVLLPSDIPLGSKGARHMDPSSTVTRMRDALSMLVSVAEKSPDIELLPWVERELSRLAYRHFGEDADRTAKFLGVNNTVLQSHLSAPAVKKAAIESPLSAAPAVKKTKKAS